MKYSVMKQNLKIVKREAGKGQKKRQVEPNRPQTGFERRLLSGNVQFSFPPGLGQSVVASGRQADEIVGPSLNPPLLQNRTYPATKLFSAAYPKDISGEWIAPSA